MPGEFENRTDMPEELLNRNKRIGENLRIELICRKNYLIETNVCRENLRIELICQKNYLIETHEFENRTDIGRIT